MSSNAWSAKRVLFAAFALFFLGLAVTQFRASGVTLQSACATLAGVVFGIFVFTRQG
jgi:hypothetical protein